MASQVTSPNPVERSEAETESLDRTLPLQIHRGGAGTERPKPLRWRLPVVSVVAILAGLGMQRFVKESVETANQREPVRSQATKPSRFALGILEPRGRVVEVAAPEGGGSARIKTILTDEGQSVRAGEILAVLDNENRLKSELESSLKQLSLAKARFEQAVIVSKTSHQEALSALRIAELSKSRADTDKQRIARLFRSKATSLEEHDTAVREAEIARFSLDASQARLARFETQEGQDCVEVAIAREEIEVRKAAVDEARARLEQAYVRAPISGSVLEIHVRAGENAGQRAILDLGSTNRMTARAEVYESLVRHLKSGQTVHLRSSALDEQLQGTVASISSVVKRQSIVDAMPAANTDARVVEVVIDLDPDSSRIASRYVGLQVRAEFVP